MRPTGHWGLYSAWWDVILFSLFSPPGCHEVSSVVLHVFPQSCAASAQVQSQQVHRPWTETYKPWAKTHGFLLLYLIISNILGFFLLFEKGSHYVVQVGLKWLGSATLLPPRSCDDRCAPLCLARNNVLIPTCHYDLINFQF